MVNLEDPAINAPRLRAEAKRFREIAKRLRDQLRAEKEKGLAKDRIRILDLQTEIARHVREAKRYESAAKGVKA